MQFHGVNQADAGKCIFRSQKKLNFILKLCHKDMAKGKGTGMSGSVWRFFWGKTNESDCHKQQPKTTMPNFGCAKEFYRRVGKRGKNRGGGAGGVRRILGNGNGSALSKVAVVGFCFAISPTPEQSNLS